MIKFSKLWGLVFLIFSVHGLIPAQKQTSKPGPKNQTSVAPPNDSTIFKNAINGIVLIETVCFDLSVRQGSGFIIDDDLIVTNKHVVSCGTAVIITLLISHEKFVVENVYHHPDHDLALLKIPNLHGNGNSLKFAPPNSIKVGNPVYVIGNPRGIEGFYSKGNIQRINSDFFWFDAPLDHGSSGSPVLNRHGEVIGVETRGIVLNEITFGGAVNASLVNDLKKLVQSGLVADYIEQKRLENNYHPAIDKILTPPEAPVSKKCSITESLNGKAISLTRPTKPGAARTVNASGRVDVRVLISENGDVIEAQSISGHALLRQAGEEAAKLAKFPPNLCGEKNARTEGIITYYFR